MRFTSFLTLTALVSRTAAFAPSKPAFCTKTMALFNSETHIDKGFTAGSDYNVDSLKTLIGNLSADNFDESLEMMEPLLLNECVGDECELYMGQLEDKCKEIGKSIPEGFAPTHH